MKKQFTQIQSRPFSRKAKTPAQGRRIVEENKAAWNAELAMLQKKAAASEATTFTAPVAPACKYLIVNGLFVVQE